MEREYSVYMHTAPNGKRYIGQTCCKPNRRWQSGFGYSKQIFGYAVKKYGWANFKHEVIAENLTSEEADKIEREYIERYQTTDPKKGYNLDEGGHGGRHLTEEHKRKIGKANSGSNNGMYGHHYTEEERKHISDTSPWKGRKHTQESRAKMSIAKKGNKNMGIGKNHHSAKAIIQYDREGNFINRFDTAVDAEKATGVLRSGICVCAKGRYKTAGGYIWRYEK